MLLCLLSYYLAMVGRFITYHVNVMTTNNLSLLRLILKLVALPLLQTDGCRGCPVRAVRGGFPAQHEHRRQGSGPAAAHSVKQSARRLSLQSCRRVSSDQLHVL